MYIDKDWESGGRPIFTLILLFWSKIDSPFSMTGTDAVFTVHLNGSRSDEIGMTFLNFTGNELDIEVIDGETEVTIQVFLNVK